MHEVGPVGIAESVNVIHVTVVRIRDPLQIQSQVSVLRVVHRFRVHQADARAHVAVREGMIGLGDHEIDLRLHLGRATGRRSRFGRVDDEYVDRRVVGGGARWVTGNVRRAAAEAARGWYQRLRLGGQHRQIDLRQDIQAVAHRPDPVGFAGTCGQSPPLPRR